MVVVLVPESKWKLLNIPEGDVVIEPNPLYMPSDTDQDGVPDTIDNCINYENTDQKDLNNNKNGKDSGGTNPKGTSKTFSKANERDVRK